MGGSEGGVCGGGGGVSEGVCVGRNTRKQRQSFFFNAIIRVHVVYGSIGCTCSVVVVAAVLLIATVFPIFVVAAVLLIATVFSVFVVAAAVVSVVSVFATVVAAVVLVVAVFATVVAAVVLVVAVVAAVVLVVAVVAAVVLVVAVVFFLF